MTFQSVQFKLLTVVTVVIVVLCMKIIVQLVLFTDLTHHIVNVLKVISNHKMMMVVLNVNLVVIDVLLVKILIIVMNVLIAE